MVKYVYDAWGNHAVLDADGNDIEDADHIGNLNPFRYRGYYYDVETGLYFLQTRYYDPETGRFISQDSIEYADPATVNGLNLYAYCGNNSVMGYDPMGTIDWSAVGRFIGGLFLGIIGAGIALGSLLPALISPVATVGCEFGLTIGMYGAALMGSAFDSTIYNDMDLIGWNPYNNDANAAARSQMMSFYNGVPIIRYSGRSGTFGIMLLKAGENEKVVKHEFGHIPQLMALGIARFGLSVGIPSWKEWGKNVLWDPYASPWEASAEMFGQANNYSLNQAEKTRAIKYLILSYFVGPFIHGLYKNL